MKRSAERRWLNCAAALPVLSCMLSASLADGNNSAAREASTAGLGTVEGLIQYHPEPDRPWKFSRYYIADAKSGALAECVVALEGTNLIQSATQSSAGTQTVDQVNFQFVPETVALRVGDWLKVKNSDDALHNVMTSDGDHPFNVTVAKGQEFTQRFDQAGGLAHPLRLGCIFHGSMREWVYVFDNPWFEVTARDGRFRLVNVPPGTYTLAVAHPAGQLHWSQPITVKADRKESVNISLSPDNRMKTK